MAFEIELPLILIEYFYVYYSSYEYVNIFDWKIGYHLITDNREIHKIYPKSFTDYLRFRQPKILLDDVNELVFFGWGRDRYKVFSYNSLEN
jgi:hypothetical protein